MGNYYRSSSRNLEELHDENTFSIYFRTRGRLTQFYYLEKSTGVLYYIRSQDLNTSVEVEHNMINTPSAKAKIYTTPKNILLLVLLMKGDYARTIV